MTTVNDWNELTQVFKRQMTQSSLHALARQLGVSPESLVALDLGWSNADGAWTFPERDRTGNVVGILRRYRDGSKRFLPGGQRGLYVPATLCLKAPWIYVPEGASDVAALISNGLHAVGRPSCTGGVPLLCDLFRGVSATIVIVGENDHKDDGHWPGRDGARQVASKLVRRGINAVWTLPPDGIKDLRDYLRQKGNSDAC